MKLTKQQAIILTAYTGIMFCRSFQDLHEDVEKRLGQPVFSHQFGNKDFRDNVIKPLYKEDFLSLIPEEGE